jgi:curli biogenesis system outer membrane secretion channel CsgG
MYIRFAGPLVACALLIGPAVQSSAAVELPLLGSDYTGPQCVAAVGPFAVHLEGAPPEIGEGLRQMLRTALFESNWFLVADREVTAGLAADRLLSDEFLRDADAIMGESAGGATRAAGILVTGALLDLESGGFGLRVKVPGAPITVGGAAGGARVLVLLQATDVATGSILASIEVEGTADSMRASVGTSLAAGALPLQLAVARNTPLELAFRDCVNRAVIRMIAALPRSVFQERGPDCVQERQGNSTPSSQERR